MKLYIPTCSRNQKRSCLFINSSLFLGSIQSQALLPFQLSLPTYQSSYNYVYCLFSATSLILYLAFTFKQWHSATFACHMHLICGPVFRGEASNVLLLPFSFIREICWKPPPYALVSTYDSLQACSCSLAMAQPTDSRLVRYRKSITFLIWENKALSLALLFFWK